LNVNIGGREELNKYWYGTGIYELLAVLIFSG
jgi:hypothetical protein